LSDFSAGTNGFTGETGGHSYAGNIDSIAGENDWLRGTRTSSDGAIGAFKTLAMPAGKWRFRGRTYIPDLSLAAPPVWWHIAPRNAGGTLISGDGSSLASETNSPLSLNTLQNSVINLTLAQDAASFRTRFARNA